MLDSNLTDQVAILFLVIIALDTLVISAVAPVIFLFGSDLIFSNNLWRMLPRAWRTPDWPGLGPGLLYNLGSGPCLEPGSGERSVGTASGEWRPLARGEALICH